MPGKRRSKKIRRVYEDLKPPSGVFECNGNNKILEEQAFEQIPAATRMAKPTEASETKSVIDTSSPECASTNAWNQAPVISFSI